MVIKVCRWLDSNCRLLASALPTDSQPLPQAWVLFVKSVHWFHTQMLQLKYNLKYSNMLKSFWLTIARWCIWEKQKLVLQNAWFPKASEGWIAKTLFGFLGIIVKLIRIGHSTAYAKYQNEENFLDHWSWTIASTWKIFGQTYNFFTIEKYIDRHSSICCHYNRKL